MRRLLFSVLAGALIVASAPAALAAAPAGLDGTLTLDPTSGPVGTVITVSGTNCSTKGDLVVNVTATNTEEGNKNVDPMLDGTWSTTFTVADDAPLGATVEVDALCQFALRAESSSVQGIKSFRGNTLFSYDTAVFTVTASPTTMSPTTEPTDDTTSTTEAGDVQDAGAAQPTTAAPTFTG